MRFGEQTEANYSATEIQKASRKRTKENLCQDLLSEISSFVLPTQPNSSSGHSSHIGPRANQNHWQEVVQPWLWGSEEVLILSARPRSHVGSCFFFKIFSNAYTLSLVIELDANFISCRSLLPPRDKQMFSCLNIFKGPLSNMRGWQN